MAPTSRSRSRFITALPRERDDALLKIVDAALAGVIFVAPLFLGGRYPVGKLVYVLFVGAAATAYCVRQCVIGNALWRRSGAEWLIFAAIVLMLTQLTPLPASWLAWCSPGLPELLPLWQAGGEGAEHFGVWRTISLSPRDTRGGMAIFLAHALLFLTLVQRLDSREDVERLLRWLAWAAMGMATLGLLQYLLGNGKFLWVYLHPSRETLNAAKGTFTNQNHFAHFLALGIGPLIWLVWRQRAAGARRTARGAVRSAASPWEQGSFLLLSVGVGAVAFAGLLTFSRGGVVTVMAAAIVGVGVFTWKKLLGVKSVVGLSVAGVVASLAILAYGYEPLMHQLGTFQESQSLEDFSKGRVILWDAMLSAVPNHPILGAGVGSHVYVYPIHLEEHTKRFSHGESGYLQVLLECGVVGVTLLGVGVVLGVSWCVRPLFQQDAWFVACAGAVLSGLVASLLHSVGDFVWYIPSCMSLAVVHLACACRLSQMARENTSESRPALVVSPSRMVWLGATTIVVLLTVFIAKDRLAPALAAPYWDDYYALMLRAQGKAWQALSDRIPADNPALVKRELAALEAAVERDPHDARAVLSLARMHLRMFDIAQRNAENDINLVQLRDAALASQFPSREAQEQWLRVAIGDNGRHLERATELLHQTVRLSPLQGEAYALLAELVFLRGYGHSVKRAYIGQALRLRPYEGFVLLAAGQEAVLEGDPQQAMQYWKRAFHADPESQASVLTMLTPQLPAQPLVEYFEPDPDAMMQLFYHYKNLNRREDAAHIARRQAPQLIEAARRQTGGTAAFTWRTAAMLFQYLEQAENAAKCLAQAVQAAPGDVAMHRAYGFQLLEVNQFDQAIEQFRWCLRHDPDDESAHAGLKQAMGGAPTATY